MQQVRTLLLVLLLPFAARGQWVSVQLADGRVVEGRLDDNRTDASRVWLERRSQSVTLTSSFPVPDIVGITRIASPKQPDIRLEELPNPFLDDGPLQVDPLLMPVTIERQKRPGRVRSIEFKANLANWDRDADVDGVLLTVFPLDEFRRVVPIDGVVYVTLNVWKAKSRDVRIQPIEKWNQRVAAAESRGQGIELKLPFKQLQDIRKRYAHSVGLLNVRLSARGSGSFEATASVPLYAPSLFYDAF